MSWLEEEQILKRAKLIDVLGGDDGEAIERVGIHHVREVVADGQDGHVRIVLPGVVTASGLPEKVLASAPTVYSVTQLLTALLGSALAFLIWLPLKKFLAKPTE